MFIKFQLFKTTFIYISIKTQISLILLLFFFNSFNLHLSTLFLKEVLYHYQIASKYHVLSRGNYSYKYSETDLFSRFRSELRLLFLLKEET